jgi:hypothetical protein
MGRQGPAKVRIADRLIAEELQLTGFLVDDSKPVSGTSKAGTDPPRLSRDPGNRLDPACHP